MFRFLAALVAGFLSWAPMSAMAQNPNPLAVSPSQNIRLERNGPTRIPLVDPATRTGETGHLNFRIPPPGGNRQTYLVLKDIFAESPPGVGYDIYLDLPAGQTPRRGDPHYVDTLSFFDTSPGHRREARLNITEKLKDLAAKGRLSSVPSVTVVPSATTTAEAQIGSVAIEAE